MVGFYLLLPFVFTSAGLDKFRLPKDVFTTVAIALLAVATVWRTPPRTWLPAGRWERLLLAALAYFGIRTALTESGAGAWFWLFNVVLFVLLFFCLNSILTWNLQKNLWIAIGAVLALNAVLTVLQYYGLFPQMLDVTGEVISGRLTPAGFIGEVNSGGFLFGLVSIFLVYDLVAGESRGRRLLAACLLAVNLLGLLYTRTLTAILGLGLAVLLWALFHHLWHFHNRGGLTRGLIIAWLAVAVGLASVGVVATHSGVSGRIQYAVRQLRAGEYSAATAGRQPVYGLTWRMILEKPLWGWGIDSFGNAFFRYRTGTEAGQGVKLLHQPGAFRQAHNEYLQSWQEAGVLGILFLLGLLLVPLISLIRALGREEDRGRQYWMGLSGVAIIYIAFICLGFFPLHLSVTAAYVVLVFAGLRRLQTAPAGSVSTPAAEGGIEAAALPLWRRAALPAATLLLLITAVGIEVPRWVANNRLGVSVYLLERALGGQYPLRQRRTFADQALFLAQTAADLSGQLVEAQRLKGSALMVLGRYQDAVAAYEKVVAAEPSPESYTNLAAALIEWRRPDRAAECLDLALRYDPQYEKAIQARAFLRDTQRR